MALTANNTNLLQLEPVSLTGYPFTLTGWFRLGSPTSLVLLMQIRNTAGSAYYSLAFFSVLNNAACILSKSTSSAVNIVPSTASMASDTWHHLAGVFESSASRKIYLDGGNMGSSNVVVDFDEIEVLWLGNSIASTTADFAKVAIWDRALSEKEVQALALRAPVLSLADLASLVTYHDCVRAANRPGWRDLLSDNGGATVIDHPPMLHSVEAQRLGQALRFPGLYWTERCHLHAGMHEAAQPDTSAVDSIAGGLAPAAGAFTATTQAGEVFTDASGK